MRRSDPFFFGLTANPCPGGAHLRRFHETGYVPLYPFQDASWTVPLASDTPPQSDDRLRQIVSHVIEAGSSSYLAGAILVTDRRSARILKRLHPHIVRGVISVFSPHELDLEFSRPVLSDDRHSLCVTLVGPRDNMVLSLQPPNGEESGRMDVLSVRMAERAPEAPSGSPCQVLSGRIILEWQGPIPGEIAKLLKRLPSPRSHRALETLGSRLSDAFYETFSPRLTRPFLKEREDAGFNFAYDLGADQLKWIPEIPEGQSLAIKRGELPEILFVIEEILSLTCGTRIAPPRLMYADGDMTIIELLRDPFIAGTFVIGEKAREVVQRVIAWSGLKGTEIRDYKGNRAGDERRGPAFLRIAHRGSESGHHHIERAAYVFDYLTRNGVCEPDLAATLMD